MFGSTVVDVAAGVVLVYFVLSLICTSLVEWIARFMSLRAETLEKGIRKLLNDPKGNIISDRFFGHSLIRGITQDGRKPSYIPSRYFAMTLLDLLYPSDPAKGPKTLQEIRDALQALPSEGLRQSIGALLEEAGNDLQAFRKSLEQWFDEAMDRVSGWYRKKAQVIAFICACVVTVAANADTVVIAKALYQDETMRKGAAALAHEIAAGGKDGAGEKASEQAEKLAGRLLTIRLPLGWERLPQLWPSTPEGWCHRGMRIAGLLVTALAVSLGAPFWFQILSKIVNLRAAGTPIAGFDEKSKRQRPAVG